MLNKKANNEKIKRYRSVIRPGEVFGFTSSLCRRPRMESAIARRDTQVLAIRRERFIEMLRQNPDIAMKIITFFAEELRTYNDMVFGEENDDRELLSDERKLFELGRHYYGKAEHQHACYVLDRYSASYPGGACAAEAAALKAELEKMPNRFITEPVVEGIYHTYADGQMIFAEYESADELYIIKEGKVKIIKTHRDEEILLSVLREGEIFGELAIVSTRPRNATAVAWGSTSLLPIRRENFTTVLRKTPAVIDRIFMAISQRIWFTYIRLESKLYTRPVTRIYVLLENKLLEDRVSLKSSKPVTIMYGIDELIRMTGVPPEKKNKTIDQLLSDPNLGFNFGRIEVENPSILSTKAKFFRSRDHLGAEDDDEPVKKKKHLEPEPITEPEPALPAGEKAPAPEPLDSPIGLDPGDLKVPSSDIPFDFDE